MVTGTGGAGASTCASAAAVASADGGSRTLLLAGDAGASAAVLLGTTVGPEPAGVPGVARLHAVAPDAARRVEDLWGRRAGSVAALLAAVGADPVAAQETTVLPGAADLVVLAALAAALSGRSGAWDVVVADMGPLPRAVALLAAPEALAVHARRLLPVQRVAATALPAGGGPVEDGLRAAVLALPRWQQGLAGLARVVSDPARTSVRLVTAGGATALPVVGRGLTGLGLLGVPVTDVVWTGAGAGTCGEVARLASPRVVTRLRRCGPEPVGVDALRAVAAEAPVPPRSSAHERWPRVTRTEQGWSAELEVPGATAADVTVTRSGAVLTVTAAGTRRLVTLPSVLQRCVVRRAAVRAGRLRLDLVPDPSLWPADGEDP